MNRTIRSKVKDGKLDFPCRSYKGLVGDPGSMQKKRSRTPDVLKVTQNNKIIITTTVTIITIVGIIKIIIINIYSNHQGSCQRLDGSSEGDSLSLAGDNYR